MFIQRYKLNLSAPMLNIMFSLGLSTLFLSPASAQILPLDCKKPTLFAEKTICSNPKLSSLDGKIFAEIEQAQQQTKLPLQMLELTQDHWIKTRNQCKNTACIEQAYQNRLQELKKINTTDPQFVKYFIRIKDQQPDTHLAILQIQMLDEKRLRVVAQTHWMSDDHQHNQSTDFSGYSNQAKKMTVKDLDSGCVLKLTQHQVLKQEKKLNEQTDTRPDQTPQLIQEQKQSLEPDQQPEIQWQVKQASPFCGNKNLRFSGRYQLQ